MYAKCVRTESNPPQISIAIWVNSQQFTNLNSSAIKWGWFPSKKHDNNPYLKISGNVGRAARLMVSGRTFKASLKFSRSLGRWGDTTEAPRGAKVEKVGGWRDDSGEQSWDSLGTYKLTILNIYMNLYKQLAGCVKHFIYDNWIYLYSCSWFTLSNRPRLVMNCFASKALGILWWKPQNRY